MTTHDIFDFISAGAAIAWLIIGLLMRASILDVKLIIQEVRAMVDKHIGMDDVKHMSIDRKFESVDSRIDHLDQRISSK